MGYMPLFTNQINVKQGTYNPSTIKPYNNEAFEFWQRALFQRAASVIAIDGWPEAWEGLGIKDFFRYILFRYGYLAVSQNDKLGLFFNPANIYGKFNFYYQPTEAIITNPHLTNELKLEIGKDCEIIKLTPDYRGIWDIIDYYAEKLALNDASVNTSLINAKIPYILGAKTKGAAEAIKRIFDKIHKGEPAAVFDMRITDDAVTKSIPFQQIRLFSKNDLITPELLETHGTILNEFDLEIGIPTVAYEKKERLVTAEAESKNIEAVARCTVWMECLNDTFKVVNKHYGTNLQAKLRFMEKEVEDGKDNDIRTGALPESGK